MAVNLFTTEHIEGYKIERYEGTVSGCMSYGQGFWTSICVAFASFFGTKVRHHADKINRDK